MPTAATCRATTTSCRALPATYPNVRIVDWANTSGSCPGNCFYDDDIHLAPDGRRFYAGEITAVTG